MKKYPLLASTLIAATSLAVPAFAADDVTWTGSSGTISGDGTIYKWSDNNNWNNGWTDGADATFTSSATNQTVTVDGEYTLGDLTISGGSYTFEYTESGSLIGSSGFTINGTDASLTITGGTNSFSSESRGKVYIGNDSSGSLTITGGTNMFSFASSSELIIGFEGKGSLTITGGTNSFSGSYMYIGYSTNSNGSLTIYDGKNTFDVSSGIRVGYNSGAEGSVTIYGGENTFTTTTMYVGYYNTGTLTIGDKNTVYTGGSSNGGENSFGAIYLGYSSNSTYKNYGNGTLDIYGGDNEFTGAVRLGSNKTASGEMNIHDGTNTFGYNLFVGDKGTGTMTISGGTNTFTGGTFYIGESSGSDGTVTITGGTNTFKDGNLFVGDSGTGKMTIYGGTNTFGEKSDGYNLYIAETSSGTGTLEIKGGTNTFASSYQYVSGSGNGTLKISGGTNTFSGENMYVTWSTNGTGLIEITGGDNIFTSTVRVAYRGTNSQGAIEISGGTTTFTNTIDLGSVGTGKMTITGGTTTISGATQIHSTGSLSIGGGESTATVYLEQQIGTSATGTVTISNNANIVLSGTLLESLEATIGDDNAWVAIITASEIIFDSLGLTLNSNGSSAEDLDSVINQYISAGDYLLTWTWDTSDSTLYASIAGTTSVPEPGMFSVFFGTGALGLVATRRRRRKA